MSIFDVIKEKTQQVVMWSLIFVVIHGEIIFNKFLWRDDIYAYAGWGDSLSHGRFTYHIISMIQLAISGTESLSVVHSIVSAVCYSLLGILIVKMFNIEELLAKIGIMIICISIPSIAGNMGYMCSSSYNAFGLLITVAAAYYAICFVDIRHSVVAALLFGIAIGEYQCYITFFLALLLCAFMKNSVSDFTSDNKDASKQIGMTLLRYALITFGGLTSYIILLKITLMIFNQQLSNYAGIDSFGIRTLDYYFAQIKQIYTKHFFLKQYGILFDMFPFKWSGWYTILVALFFWGAFLCAIECLRRRKFIQFVMLLISVIVTPTIFYFNFVMYNMSYTHSLHMYHFVILFVMMYILTKYGMGYTSKWISSLRYSDNLEQSITKCVSIFIIVLGIMYVRYDNLCYTSAEIQQQQAISLLSALISDIHNTPGYYSEIPICYVNGYEPKYTLYHSMSYSDPILTNPFNRKLVNIGEWKLWLKTWCNFEPQSIINEEDVDQEIISEVKKMPRYPDNGSIRVINDILFINF